MGGYMDTYSSGKEAARVPFTQEMDGAVLYTFPLLSKNNTFRKFEEKQL